MKRKLLCLTLSLMMLLSVATACGGKNNSGTNGGSENTASEESASSDSGGFVSIATGGTGGTYYPLGGALATILNNADIGIQANAQSTGASIENVQLIHNGDAEIAFIQNDVSYYAANGKEFFSKDNPDADPAVVGVYDELRGIACVYPEVVQIIVSNDSGIKTVNDLKGKRVAVGAPGSSVEVNGRQIVEAYGLSYDDFAKTDFLSFTESADGIKNGQIDAAFMVASVPASAVTELATTYDIHLLPIEKEVADKIIEQYPYYTYSDVDVSEYRGSEGTIPALSVKAMLVVNKSMSEDECYNITKALFENLDTFGEAHARGKDLTLETALEGMSLEVHPGAQKYFDEQK
ncbi:TAXI family TRAP transporter solute-binding subunit [Peptoniphilus catoniae]|uniref:TAXI family TRAP transporter solute-binding subunit n=1 Tax=Peptoniphilus catoniae TaxID=1660341 RepID=UPI001FEB24E1|nr:TAXI family TRAP transporter solute-binding subunit [Peptoniphilus catoniae]